VRLSIFPSTLVVIVCISGFAQAGTLTPVVDAPGADAFSTAPLGINAAGLVGGGYTTGGGAVEHGFVGPPTGPYATFDYSTSSFVTAATEVRALNDAGSAVGFAADVLGGPNPSFRDFLRAASGTFVELTNPATGIPFNGIAQGINSAGYVVGDYDVPDGFGGFISHGFILSPDYTTLTDLSAPLAAAAPVAGCGIARIPHGGTRARGINDVGTVTGFYFDVSCVAHGFVYDIASGIYTTFDHPLASGAAGTLPGHRGQTGTFLPGINNAGQIAGSYTDASGNYQGFLLDSTHTQITSINAPGATYSQVFGINNLGQVTIASDAGGFVWSPTSTGTPTDALLPLSSSRGGFQFKFQVAPGVTYYIDPNSPIGRALAGYDYRIGSGNPNFSSVTMPIGTNPGVFKVWVCDGSGHCMDTGVLAPGGSTYDFLSNGWPAGVSEFRLTGINRTVDLNRADPNASSTGVAFVGAGPFTGTMTSLCRSDDGLNQFHRCGSDD
jgi:hypothetical protein